MTSLRSTHFWADALERSFKTVAQTAAALLVADGTDLLNTGWTTVVAVAGMAGVVSLLTSIGSTQTGNPDSASVIE